MTLFNVSLGGGEAKEGRNEELLLSSAAVKSGGEGLYPHAHAHSPLKSTAEKKGIPFFAPHFGGA